MPIFKVNLKEICEQEIEIEAENEDIALCEAEELYYNGDIVMNSLDFVNLEAEIINN